MSEHKRPVVSFITQIEQLQTKKVRFKQQRDDLLAACEKLRTALGSQQGQITKEEFIALGKADEAIAKAKERRNE